MLISNYKVFVTDQGNGAISFVVQNVMKKVIIPKEDTIPKQIFDLYYLQLSSFKNRHYAIARWIVKDIRRMGYEFKEMPFSKGLYYPVKLDQQIFDEFPAHSTREEKLKFLWNEIEKISRKLEKVNQ